MIELGKVQTLKILRFITSGAFVGVGDEGEDGGILLPKKYVNKSMEVGSDVEVFVYCDSQDRLVATTEKPLLQVGEVGVLKVVETGKLGAFLDWGLEKDLLLPHREQREQPQKGRHVLVTVYVDRSERLCATTRIEKYLTAQSPFAADDKVTGTVYQISENIGVLVAVENRYIGLIPRQEAIGHFKKGDRVECRVASVREDGKLILSLKEKAHIQMDADTAVLLELLEKRKGFLDLNDDSHPEKVRSVAKMSKRAFKRAVGRLLREDRIELADYGIRLLPEKKDQTEKQ